MARRHTFDHAHRIIAAQRGDQWTTARNDLDACAPHIRDVINRIMDARPSALAAASYDGPKVTSGKGSSSTERLALTRQVHSVDLALLDRCLAGLSAAAKRPEHPSAADIAQRNARDLWRLVQAWKPHAPSDRDRRNVDRLNVPEECQHTRKTVNTFEPVHRTTDFDGLLDQPIPVCRFVYDFTRRAGRLPSDEEMRRHHEGRRIHLPA